LHQIVEPALKLRDAVIRFLPHFLALFLHIQDGNFFKRVAPSDKNYSSESAKNNSKIEAESFKTGSRLFFILTSRGFF
jgi:hypothetical protein